MFLNTNLIKDSILSKNTLSEGVSPLILKDQQLEHIKLEKERKLQEQVSMIFKDPNYYKRFQEAVMPPGGIKPPEEEKVVLTPQEKDRRAREDEVRAKQMGHATKNVVLGSTISAGINTIGGSLIRKALGA